MSSSGAVVVKKEPGLAKRARPDQEPTPRGLVELRALLADLSTTPGEPDLTLHLVDQPPVEIPLGDMSGSARVTRDQVVEHMHRHMNIVMAVNKQALTMHAIRRLRPLDKATTDHYNTLRLKEFQAFSDLIAKFRLYCASSPHDFQLHQLVCTSRLMGPRSLANVIDDAATRAPDDRVAHARAEEYLQRKIVSDPKEAESKEADPKKAASKKSTPTIGTTIAASPIGRKHPVEGSSVYRSLARVLDVSVSKDEDPAQKPVVVGIHLCRYKVGPAPEVLVTAYPSGFNVGAMKLYVAAEVIEYVKVLSGAPVPPGKNEDKA